MGAIVNVLIDHPYGLVHSFLLDAEIWVIPSSLSAGKLLQLRDCG
jgi:hypothetical protein